MRGTIKFGMCSALILSRLNELNQQLTIISKLQRMEEDTKINSQSRYKKCNGQNNHRKSCRCVHHLQSLTDHCNRFNCSENDVPINYKKSVPCNLETCEAKRAICLCKSTRLIEVQTNFPKDAETQKNKKIAEKSIATDIPTKTEEKDDKSDVSNVRLSKINLRDKLRDTHEGRNTENIPSDETDRVIVPDNDRDVSSNMNEYIEQLEIGKNGDVRERKQIAENLNELERKNDTQDVPERDRRTFERISKDLLNERKRTKELEEKLKSLTCSLDCLKEDNKQKAACLRDAMKDVEQQTKLAATSRNLAMDLAKQSKDQMDIVKMDRDKLLAQIANLQKDMNEVSTKNAALTRERDDLKGKLKALTDDEAIRCGEVEEEVNRMKCAIKEKEEALNKERKEFTEMISELMNVIKIQKRRICEVTGICNNQQHRLEENANELSQKDTELSELQTMLQSNDCKCKEMEEKIQHLEYCLCEETKACECLKQELDGAKENHYSELRIKDKIIEEQSKTIARQKKLLLESEKMAQQAASEFDALKEELYYEQERSNSLQMTLENLESQLNTVYQSDCKKCQILADNVEHANQEKEKAIATAKFAIQKLYRSMRDYQNQLASEKKQHRSMALVVQDREQEIRYLRREIYQSGARVT